MGSQILILFFALSPLPGLFWGGAWVYVTPVLTFIILPLLDLLLPKAKSAGSTSEKPTFLLYAYLPYHAALILGGARAVRDFSLSDPQFWWLALSVGIVTGSTGITFAHEWVHKLKTHQKLYGEWLLVWVGYGHYATEHVYGHHKHVATFEDGATARKGEWLQAYIPRALFQVWRSAFRIKPGRTLAHGLASIVILAGVFLACGKMGALFFVLQGTVAVLLLTSIDYVEHYGLERKKTPEGRYESVKPWHSWDSDTLVMGELLIHLQRHADHHMKPLKAYPALELHPEASKLPTGYGGMIWLAWWPQLWFRIMDPRIERKIS